MLVILKVKSKTEELPLSYIQNPRKDIAISDTITFAFTTLNRPNNLGYRLVENENIVEYEGHEYRIKQRAKRPKYTNVTAVHIYSDLVGTRREKVLKGWYSVSYLLDFIFNGTGWMYRLLSDKNVYVENFGKNNIVKLMKELCELADIEFVILPNKVLHVANRLSGDYGAIYRYKHNIKTIGEEFDSTSLRTKITGHFKNGSVTYISPYAEIFGEIEADPYTNEEIKTKEEMLEILKTQLNDTIKFAMEIEVTDTGPKELGETVRVIHEELGTNLTARVLKIEETLVNNELAPTSQTVGNYIFEDYTTTVVKQLNKNKAELQQQATILNTVQVAVNGKNSVFRGPDEPRENLQKGDLWYQPTENGETKMYQYTGTHWELILDTAKTTEISNKVDEAFQDAQSAIDAAENAQLRADQANQEAEQALTQAQTSFDTAQNALTQANNLSVSVDGIATRVTNAEGDISTLTQTTSGLQTRVANAEGNISTLTQTASALQTKMTNAEGSISTLTQTATSLTSRIDNLQVGGKNIIRLSDFKSIFGWTAWNTSGKLSVSKVPGFPNELLNQTKDSEVPANTPIAVHNSSVSAQGFSVVGGKDYTLSYFIRPRGIARMNYCYLLYNDGGSNQSLPSVEFAACPVVKMNGYDYYYVTHHFKANRDGTGVRVLIGGRSDALYGAETTIPYFYLNRPQLEEGTFATSWDVAPDDISSQITQLSDNINLKVSKNDVVNQINVSTEGILIDGKKVHITGTTTIDNGVIKSAMIANLAVDTSKIADLAVTNAKIVNVTADKIVANSLSAISANLGTITAGTITGVKITTVSGSNSSVIDSAAFTSYRNGRVVAKMDGTGFQVWDEANNKVLGILRDAQEANGGDLGTDLQSYGGFLSLGFNKAGTTSLPWIKMDRKSTPPSMSVFGSNLDGEDSGRLLLYSTAKGGTADGKVSRIEVRNYYNNPTYWGNVMVYTGRDNNQPNGGNERFGFEVWQYRGTGDGAAKQMMKIDTAADGKTFVGMYTDEVVMTSKAVTMQNQAGATIYAAMCKIDPKVEAINGVQHGNVAMHIDVMTITTSGTQDLVYSDYTFSGAQNIFMVVAQPYDANSYRFTTSVYNQSGTGFRVYLQKNVPSTYSYDIKVRVVIYYE